MTITAIEKAKELCPYWVGSERESWKIGFFDGANNSYRGESEDDDISVYSYGYRAGKKWQQELSAHARIKQNKN